MKAVYRKRLERLAQLLENWSVEKKFLLPAPTGRIEKFDIGEWCCGTAACALGSAALLPEFRKAGLTLENVWEIPEYRGEDGVEAGEKFFGLDDVQSSYLFMSYTYERNPSPKTVAKRVREILEGKA